MGSMVDDLTPEELEGIRKGLLDAHLGRVFTWYEVKMSLNGSIRYGLWVKSKRLYWRLKYPFQLIWHRNCDYCRRHTRENFMRRVK